MRWNTSFIKVLDYKEDKVCKKSKGNAVTIPFFWSFHEAIKICNLLGNGKIYSFSNSQNLTKVNFETIFGTKFWKLKYFWTPYTDEMDEGVYRDIYDGEIKNLHFQYNQPNGGIEENHVLLSTKSRQFVDGADEREDVSVNCWIPKDLLILR